MTSSTRWLSNVGSFVCDRIRLNRRAIAHYSKIAFLVLSWYATSLTLTACNKILLDSLAFPYPVFVTFIHFVGVGLLVRTALEFRPNRYQKQAPANIMTTCIIPTAILSALEITLTNQAYSLVSLSALTLIKSTLVAATYFASIIAKLEKFQKRMVLVLTWIIASVGMSLPSMELEQSWGVLLLCFGVIAAACRWVLIHKNLNDSNFSSMELIGAVQPVAALCLVPVVASYDAVELMQSIMWEPTDAPRVCAIAALLTIAIVLVVGLLACEFGLIELTSSLTLTVAGVGKECLTVAMSALFFQERLSSRTILGLVSSVLGISMYGYMRSAAQQGEKHTQTIEASFKILDQRKCDDVNDENKGPS